MAHYCCVCKEVIIKEDNIVVYNFPRDPAWKKAWEKRIRRENLPYYAEICARHFTPDCFYKNMFGGVYLKHTALPTAIDDPPTEETQTKVHLGPSEFSNRNRIRCEVPVANAVTKIKKKITSLQKERASLKRKIALQTKYLEELEKLKFFDTDSSASGRKRLLLSDPEEERSIEKRPKTSKPSATATQLGSGTPSPLVENIRIKEEPEEDIETSKPSARVPQLASGTTTLVDNMKKKEVLEEGDVTIALESVLEVENAKIKTEPLSDSEQELTHLSQEYRTDIIRKRPDSFEDAILGFPLESTCGVAQKCSDPPSDDAILGFPLESRCGVAQKCSDPPPDDAILGFPLESACGVAQKCSDPSDDAILGFPHESRCGVVQKCPDKSDDGCLVPQESASDVVQKCSDPSDDAILGVPVEYLPLSCQDVSDKLEHNQFSASGSATSDHIQFMHLKDQAATSQNAPPTFIPMELVPSAIPVSENPSAVNPVLENQSDDSSTSESLSDEDSKNLFEDWMSKNLSDQKNSVSCNREKDEFDLFGEFVASKLRSMQRKKAIQIQSKFGDLLFKLESGELNLYSAKMWLNNIQFR